MSIINNRAKTFKSYSVKGTFFARITDSVSVFFSGLIAYSLRFNYVPDLNGLPQNYFSLLIASAILSLIIFPLFGLYHSWRGQSLFHQIRLVIMAWGTVIVCVIIFLFLLKYSEEFSRIWLAYWFSTGVVLILLIRLLAYLFLRLMRSKGFNYRSVVIIGAGDLGKEVLQRVSLSAWTGFKVVALFDDNTKLTGGNIFGVLVRTDIVNIIDYVSSHHIDEVWFALPLNAEERMHDLVNQLSSTSVNVRLIPDIFGLSILNHGFTEIAGMPVVDLCTSPMTGFNRVVKSIEDKVLAFIILVLISPLLFVIAAGIKLTSKGPVFFKQKRHGWDGRIINVYKFRSMKVHQEFDGSVTQAIKRDPRITKMGAFLRRTSLDELPQFYNVLQGRMSIVGPRPHAVAHNEHYKEVVDQYMLRHKVKPGITGWAQVNGWRGETDTVEKMQKRVEFDLFYIENWSLWFDLKIIFLTVFKGFVDKNAY